MSGRTGQGTHQLVVRNIVEVVLGSLGVVGLAGATQQVEVAQHELDIGNGNRSVDHVFSVLGDCGFEPASPSEYRRWMDSRRGILT